FTCRKTAYFVSFSTSPQSISFKCPNFTRMHSHPGKDSTNFLTFRFNLDGAAHPALQWEFVSLSHRLDFPRHYNDETKRNNVTDGRSLSLVRYFNERRK